MTDRETVLADLFSDKRRGKDRPAWKSVRVVPDEGVVHLDYNDPDYAYRLTVTTVPRRHLDVPDSNVAEISGIGIRLTSVEICNDTTVVIDAHDGPSYQADMTAFRAAYERWEQTAQRPLPPPPEWPAGKFFGCVCLSDDVGTDYVLHGGRSGGSGTEFECTHTFDPVPPVNAQHLRVDVVDHHVFVGTVSLDL